MSRNRTKNNKQIQYKTLLSVLANGSELESRDLLKKYSGQDAQNTQDLEVKLARTYALSTDKREIEKQFALIHPHKDFILKYIKPQEELQPLKAENSVKPQTELVETEKSNYTVLHDGYSSADGSSNSCACGRCSGGYSNVTGAESIVRAPESITNYVGLMGMVAVVGIVFFVLTKTVNK